MWLSEPIIVNSKTTYGVGLGVGFLEIVIYSETKSG